MSIAKSFAMALSSIVNNKVRSLLTMLGIIIGITAVIVLVSVMNGLTNEVSSAFSDFGTSALTVRITPRANKEVTPVEMYDFADSHTELYNGVSPDVTLAAEVKAAGAGDDTLTTACSGISEDYAEIQKIDISFGRFIAFSDCENEARSAVIGSYQALYFFGTCEDAVGETIRINGLPYTVVGVVEEKEDSTQSSSDDKVYIPYTTALKANGTNKVTSYTVNAASDEKVDEAKTLLESFMLEKIGDSDYFSVTSMKEMIEKMTETLDKMELVLIAIAAISLLVGGIGIMNIMLVSVSERTREIGIRKSLGAKHRHIMTQFVMESGTVSCIGGIIGIILGVILSFAAGKALGMSVSASVGAVGAAFGVSVSIGVVFGFLPARKAARLNPIDALRSD